MGTKENVEEAFDALKEQRDELMVRMHLASMEVRDEWEELERQWQYLVSKKNRLKRDLTPAIDDAHIKWMLLKDELVAAYGAIRDRV